MVSDRVLPANRQQSSQTGGLDPTPGAEPFVPRRVLVLLAIAALATAAIAPFDLAVSSAVRAGDSRLLRAMVAITDVGLTIWYVTPAATLLVLAVLARRVRSDRQERQVLKATAVHAAYVLCAVVGAALVTNILKNLIGRARPALADRFGAFHFEPLAFDDIFRSFPSGHATTVGAVTVVLILWFPRALGPLLCLGAFLAATRVAALAHYPSDVVAGFAIGAAVAILVARAFAANTSFFSLRPGKILPVIGGPARQN